MTIRILIADDFEAVRKAEELQPELILLDIGLPELNGIEAARRIREASPSSKIIFLSQENSPEVVKVALSTGAQGYVHKSRARKDLLSAIEATLRGERFISGMLKGDEFTDNSGAKASHRHEVFFYSDDEVFLKNVTRFIAAALEAGDVAIVVATEAHRNSLVERLKTRGLDVAAAIREGAFIPLDVSKTLSTFMVNGIPDSDRFFEVVGDFIRGAAKAGKNEHPRVVAFGECAPMLWLEGKADAAIRVEQLWDQIATIYEVEILCAYGLSSFHSEEDQDLYKGICAEHSTVYSQENN